MDMDKLRQSLFNFVKNAMESISGEGTTFEILLPTERHEDKGAISNRAWRGIRNATPKAYLRQE
jgi:nitrogen-specific signal transduction histidine kinase